MNKESYNLAMSAPGPAACHPTTIRERLQMQQQTLRESLSRVDAALAALDATPEIDRVLEAVSRVAPLY